MAAAKDLKALEKLRVEFLGRQGRVTGLLRGLGQLPAEERPATGAAANRARTEVEETLTNRRRQLQEAAERGRLAAETLDVTIPGRRPQIGHQHPLTLVMEQLCAIFIGLGFEVIEGPEVELYRYNFEALNYPPDHPAMDEQDSFYVNDEVLLRTHTSPVQIRGMKERAPQPSRLIAPGRVYRRENVTMTHSHTFYQLEGLLVDKGINFGHLKGILEAFAQQYFGAATRVRIRPDFFPFVEPGGDVSINCTLCDGAGCKFCKDSGWVEIAGCGMVHPEVLRAGGYDPREVTGFAFGMGIDRLTQRRFDIEHIRLLYENDMRFLSQS
ncbi:MAG: phenylalanine--tRNA ligase subunit alpha [Armatimonadetes bacterium]|nr:phenylalanine--tRNA ligase subunit alpha [Armatimonadota bacterium]NIM24622.1 phenylalanine--tRNA ligase subunit alpha [Armatimonadota bacterium]NIM68501.1 phenylalanine--tRNA ligase subunit alpha [Armatimonadota bacterium]NIM76883.1 phenylalanine--tRNA ligase subunit alpha [Armatimonadota bacterium]NIN06695.1 phenylalanine--tRNA ligase subunit alpha [Armatimonadota bacterium]